MENDMSTPEPEPKPEKPLFNAAESPVLRLFFMRDRRGKSYIDAAQLAAAGRLRADFERANLQPRLTMAYSEPDTLNGGYWASSDNQIAKLSDGAIAARHRFAAAFELLGPELSGVAYHVCCLASGFEFAERVLALPPRSGKAILSIALNKLARHYGIKKPSNHAKIEHWGIQGYRPDFILPPIETHQP
jgi:Domain of unknown function (DUF6456)